jgi:hypothetical protein
MEATASQSFARPAPRRLRVGLVVSALPVLFLTFDGVIKVIETAPVVEAFARLGYPESLAHGIGFLELACLVAYALPRTAILGAILLTGFLGGAISCHVRIGDPLFSHVLFPVYVAALLWAGLFLREPRLAALLPFRKPG